MVLILLSSQSFLIWISRQLGLSTKRSEEARQMFGGRSVKIEGRGVIKEKVLRRSYAVMGLLGNQHST
jgi:hypothetical protein